MASVATFSDRIRRASNAARSNDRSQVSKLLCSSRSIPSGIDLELLPSSQICEELLARLATSNPVSDVNVIHTLRALLLLSPCYETPWRATFVLIEGLHARSGWLGEASNVVFAGIANVRSFLQETISHWWRQESVALGTGTFREGIASTPRCWLLKISQKACCPLREEIASSNSSDNRHWVIPLDLVSTILSLCQELEGVSSTTSQAILDTIYHGPILMSRMLPLLSLTQNIRNRLRHGDWVVLYDLLKEALQTQAVPFPDLPGIARVIIMLSDEHPTWRALLLDLLHAASHNMMTYSTLETMVHDGLTSQSMQSLYGWHLVSRTENIPHWIIANYHLLLFQATRHSGFEVVSRLLREALGEDAKGYNMVDLCCQSLVKLCLPTLSRDRRKSDPLVLMRLLDGVKYEAEGRFSRENQSIEELELTVLIKSLYLGSSKLEHSRQKLSAAERAQAWINAAKSMLLKPDLISKITAILIYVAVFCEIPASRSTLVRAMVGESKSLDEESCIIIGMVARSITEERELQALDQITSSLSSRRLPFDLFRPLADALAQTSAGRDWILTISEKKLCMQNAPWWETLESGASSARKETMQSALYGLCALLVKSDKMSLSAWKILYDFLVVGKPSLPVSIRSWLYSELWMFLKLDKLPPSFAGKLFRALLTRLMHYFAWTKGDLKFVPQKTVASFAGSQYPLVRDDLCSLLGIVIDLLLKSVEHDALGEQCLQSCREKLRSLFTKQTSASFVLGDVVNSSFYVQVVSSLLASCSLQIFSMINKSPLSHGNVSVSSSLNDVARLMVKEEGYDIAQLQSNGRAAIPKCFDGNVDLRSCGNESDLPPDVSVLILHLALRFMMTAKAPLDSAAQMAFAINISRAYIFGRRMKSDYQSSILTSLHCFNPDVLSIFSQVVLRMLADETQRLEDLDLILSGIECVCDDISSFAHQSCEQSVGNDNALRLLGEIYMLYHNVASERPISRLLCILESSLKSQPSRPHKNRLLAMTCSGDADKVIHGFRTRLLEAVVDCTKTVSIGLFGIIDPSFPRSSRHLEIEGEDALVFIAKLLQSCTNDLSEGLNFESGGITSQMYILFLEIIEISCSLLHKGARYGNDRLVVHECVIKTSQLLNEVMRSYTISAPLFRRTIHLATGSLFCLRRSLWSITRQPTKNSDDAPIVFFINLSSQVLNILEEMSSEIPIVWSRPIEHDEMLPVDDRDEDVEAEESTNPIPLEIVVPIASTVCSRRDLVVILESEVAWTYALNAVLTIIDKGFSESSPTVQECEDAGSIDASLFECPQYVFWRREEISSYLVVIGRCLQHDEAKTDDSSLVNVLALHIPKASKFKFLIIVEKAVLVLTRVFRLLIKTVQNGIVQSSRARAEAIATIAAWSSQEQLNLITGTRRWFQAERQHVSKTHEVNKVFTRLPKTLVRIEELESTLRKIDSVIHDWVDVKNEGSQESRRWKIFEEAILFSLQGDGRQSDDFSFIKAVTKCLDSSTESRDYYKSFYIGPLAGGQVDLGHKRKRVNGIEKRVRRERKRPIPRSRNPVIDLYQQLDHEEGYDDDYDYDDAYVDLEEFLVEG